MKPKTELRNQTNNDKYLEWRLVASQNHTHTQWLDQQNSLFALNACANVCRVTQSNRNGKRKTATKGTHSLCSSEREEEEGGGGEGEGEDKRAEAHTRYRLHDTRKHRFAKHSFRSRCIFMPNSLAILLV